MGDRKEDEKSHTIKNVVTILAVSAVIVLLVVLPAYGHENEPLDGKGGHMDKEGVYHIHKTNKEMVEYVRKFDQKAQELLNNSISPSEAASQTTGLPYPLTVGAKKDAEERKEFLGVNVGVGIGLLHGLGPGNIGATLGENGIVSVVEDNTNTLDLFLEAHYYHEDLMIGNNKDIAHGPFVLVNTGAAGFKGVGEDLEALSLFGVGWMLGIRVGDKAINIGAAYALRRGVQSLRSDFVVGQEAPSDDMGNFVEPKYAKSTEGAWVILVSFNPF